MKIAIDLSPVEDSPAGIGQYTINLVSELVEHDKKNEYIVYTRTPRLLPHTKNVVIKVNRSLPFSGKRWIKAVAKHAKKHSVDIFISPSNHSFSWYFPKTIQFVHDIAPLKFPNYFPALAAFKYKRSLAKAMKKAWKIVTVSNTIKKELEEYSKQKRDDIEVLYPGLNPWIIKSQKDILTSELIQNLPAEFILSVGTLEPRKNYINLIAAYAKYEDQLNIPLVIVGKKGWYFEEIYKTIIENNLEKKVILAGYIADEDLAILYSQAKAFVYISHYEGFGIPPIEALYHGLPILVSDIPIFHETLGDKVRYCNQQSIESIGTGLVSLAKEEKSKSSPDYLSENYSWEKSADKLSKIIDSANYDNQTR